MSCSKNVPASSSQPKLLHNHDRRKNTLLPFATMIPRGCVRDATSKTSEALKQAARQPDRRMVNTSNGKSVTDPKDHSNRYMPEERPTHHDRFVLMQSNALQFTHTLPCGNPACGSTVTPVALARNKKGKLSTKRVKRACVGCGMATCCLKCTEKAYTRCGFCPNYMCTKCETEDYVPTGKVCIVCCPLVRDQPRLLPSTSKLVKRTIAELNGEEYVDPARDRAAKRRALKKAVAPGVRVDSATTAFLSAEEVQEVLSAAIAAKRDAQAYAAEATVSADAPMAVATLVPVDEEASAPVPPVATDTETCAAEATASADAPVEVAGDEQASVPVPPVAVDETVGPPVQSDGASCSGSECGDLPEVSDSEDSHDADGPREALEAMLDV